MSSNEYPSDWNSRRKKVYRRDGYECQNCGAMGGRKGNAELHAHHIVPKSRGGTHDTTNLVTICKDCHDAVHGNKQAPTGDNQSSSFVHVIESRRDLLTFIDNINDVYEKATGLGSLHNLSLPQIINDSDTINEWYETVRKQTTELSQVRLELDYNEASNHMTPESDDIKRLLEQWWDIRQESLGDMSKISVQSQRYMELIQTVECDGCGNTEESSVQFCGSCGNKLNYPLQCDECGENIETPTQEFCKSCGAGLSGFSEEKVEEIQEIEKELKELRERLIKSDEKAKEIFLELKG